METGSSRDRTAALNSEAGVCLSRDISAPSCSNVNESQDVFTSEKRPDVLMSFTGTQRAQSLRSREAGTKHGLTSDARAAYGSQRKQRQHVHEHTGEFTVAVSKLWTHHSSGRRLN